MKRIVITLATLIGFSGVAFAEPTLNTAANDNARTSFSKVEATSYIASLSDQGQYQVFNP